MMTKATDPPMIAFMRGITEEGPLGRCLACGDTRNGFDVADCVGERREVDGETISVVPCPCGEGSFVLVDCWTASAVVQVYDAFKREESRAKFAALGLLEMVDITWKLVG